MNLTPVIFPQPANKKEMDVFNSISKFFESIRLILNGGLLFADNFDMRMVTFTTAGANTEVEIAHTLGKIPIGYTVYGQDVAGSLYTSTGGTAWSKTSIYLKSSVATVTFKVLVF
jgi:hypothetical protein